MSMLGNNSFWDVLSGNPDAGDMKSTIGKGMGQFIGGMQGYGNQLGNYGTQAMDWNSGQNVAQRNQFQTAASDATATGAMNAQRMASQQGMGGSGLLQQATSNQAYSNMMGAGQQGVNSFLNNQKAGASYLQGASNILGNAGSMQSDLNVSNANVMRDNAANRGQLLQGMGTGLFNAMLPGDPANVLGGAGGININNYGGGQPQ